MHKNKQLIRIIVKEYERRYIRIKGFSEFFKVEKHFNILQIGNLGIKSKALTNNFDFNLKHAKLNDYHALQK